MEKEGATSAEGRKGNVGKPGGQALPAPEGPSAMLPREHTHPWALCTSGNEASTCKFRFLKALSPQGDPQCPNDIILLKPSG